MKRLSLLFVAVLLVAAFGAAEGKWTGRWEAVQAADVAALRLADVPLVFGEWEGKDLDLDERQVKIGRLTGYVNRLYVRKGTGESLSVLLLCGKPGPISVHTPDLCFKGLGYTMAGDKVRSGLVADGPAGPADFWTGRFEKDDAEPLDIRWGWASDGRWDAVENPRTTYARSGALFKLYFIRPATVPADRDADQKAAASFAREFLPVVKAALFPTPAPAGK